MKKALSVLLIALLLLFGFAGWFVFDKLGKLTDVPEQIEGEVSDEDLGLNSDGLSEQEMILSESEIFKDSDVFNLLLLGTDERTKEFNTNARADSIMLLSINKETNDLHLISIERGIGVPILEGAYEGQVDWITHCFRYGGAELMLKEVSECFKVDVSHYVRVNFHAFEQLIDSVGGVDIELTQAEVNGLNGKVYTNARTKKTVKVGLNHLDGYDALQYSRLRFIDSDWKRIERQRNVISAVVKQSKEMNLFELNDLLDEVLPLIETNLSTVEIAGLLVVAPGFLGADIQQDTLPIDGSYGVGKGMGNRTVYTVDFEKNAAYLQNLLYGVNENE